MKPAVPYEVKHEIKQAGFRLARARSRTMAAVLGERDGSEEQKEHTEAYIAFLDALDKLDEL